MVSAEISDDDLLKWIENALMHGMGAEFCLEKGRKTGTLVLEQSPYTKGPMRSALYPDILYDTPEEWFKELEPLLGSAFMENSAEKVLEHLQDIKAKGYRILRTCKI
jgi:hypothetical protein